MRQLKITKQVTNRESLSLDKYLQEIGKVPLIDAEREVELARRIKKGDQLALEQLTKANLRFVVSVAKQYQNQGLTLGDLINEGNLGLIKAAQRFDETRGLNSFHMLYGGFARAYFRHLQSNLGSSGFLSTRSVTSTRSTELFLN